MTTEQKAPLAAFVAVAVICLLVVVHGRGVLPAGDSDMVLTEQRVLSGDRLERVPEPPAPPPDDVLPGEHFESRTSPTQPVSDAERVPSWDEWRDRAADAIEAWRSGDGRQRSFDRDDYNEWMRHARRMHDSSGSDRDRQREDTKPRRERPDDSSQSDEWAGAGGGSSSESDDSDEESDQRDREQQDWEERDRGWPGSDSRRDEYTWHAREMYRSSTGRPQRSGPPGDRDDDERTFHRNKHRWNDDVKKSDRTRPGFPRFQRSQR